MLKSFFFLHPLAMLRLITLQTCCQFVYQKRTKASRKWMAKKGNLKWDIKMRSPHNRNNGIQSLYHKIANQITPNFNSKYLFYDAQNTNWVKKRTFGNENVIGERMPRFRWWLFSKKKFNIYWIYGNNGYGMITALATGSISITQ